MLAYARGVLADSATNGRSRIHFVTTHFSPSVTGSPACSEAASA
jgi:hypothetical protein